MNSVASFTALGRRMRYNTSISKSSMGRIMRFLLDFVLLKKGDFFQMLALSNTLWRIRKKAEKR
jgi:hypothetical protein